MQWTNWGGTYTCHPARIVYPRTEDEIVELVRQAGERGEQVKVAGSGHSFTDIACTEGLLIKLDHYNLVLAIDRGARTVTVQSGIRIVELAAAIAPFGMAMENIGDVGYQTISGAISTATHGTGERLRNIPSQVVGLRLVLADGTTLDCSAEQEPEVFEVARVGLGALGVVSAVTLRCVPAYFVRSLQQPMRIDEALATFDQRAAASDHFELFWWPHTGWAQTITNTRTQDPPSERSRRTGWWSWANDILIENHAFGMIQRVAVVNPGWIPRLSVLTARTMTRKEVHDRSDRVFANERLVRFAEMEYAVPRAHLIQAVRDVRAMLERTGFNVSFPVEVRTVAADDIPLSPAFGRPTGYVAVHVFHQLPYEPYFREVEAIMNAHEGRPHWGKLHFQTAETLRPRYPLWDRFITVRDGLDPERRFGNAYLERVLGGAGEKVPG